MFFILKYKIKYGASFINTIFCIHLTLSADAPFTHKQSANFAKKKHRQSPITPLLISKECKFCQENTQTKSHIFHSLLKQLFSHLMQIQQHCS